MDRQALNRLVDAARSLPGERVDVEFPSEISLSEARTREVGALRKRVAAILGELANRLEPELVGALGRSAWDQVDALAVVDDDLRRRAAALRAEWHDAGGPAAAEALLVLDTALALVELVERRLATLVRLAHRGPDRPLVANGRAFLDLPGALVEAARGWS
jgi:hypothetical protein